MDEDDYLIERSKRVKLVVRLSYDELGKPSDQPLNVLSHGVLVGSGTFRDSRYHLCRTVWCHAMALCRDCHCLNTASWYKRIQVI